MLRGLLREFPTVESEPSIIRIRVIRGRYSCALVAEVKHEGAGLAGQVAGGETILQLEVAAARADSHLLTWIVEFVTSTDVEHAAVFSLEVNW